VHIIFLIHTSDLGGAEWVSGGRGLERGRTNEMDLRWKKRERIRKSLERPRCFWGYGRVYGEERESDMDGVGIR